MAGGWADAGLVKSSTAQGGSKRKEGGKITHFMRSYNFMEQLIYLLTG